jgi:hypothetical protein
VIFHARTHNWTCDRVPTVALVSFSRLAIELFAPPSALLSTMRARLLSAAGYERLRMSDDKCA